jgi:hypothetical protein
LVLAEQDNEVYGVTPSDHAEVVPRPRLP